MDMPTTMKDQALCSRNTNRGKREEAVAQQQLQEECNKANELTSVEAKAGDDSAANKCQCANNGTHPTEAVMALEDKNPEDNVNNHIQEMNAGGWEAMDEDEIKEVDLRKWPVKKRRRKIKREC